MKARHVHELDAYADNVDLRVPFDRSRSAGSSSPEVLERLAAWLLRDAGLTTEEVPAVEEARRRLIRLLLTVRPPRPIPQDAAEMLDDVFAGQAAGRPVIAVDEVLASAEPAMSVGPTRVVLWRGDITTLAVDAIVNAANANLLGCFQPGHTCIDNAIHSAAGPRLREDCRRIIEWQGHAEPTGTAKITRAYYLPSRFVLHTVGPIVPRGDVTEAHRTSLAASYEACLELAAAAGVTSLAFCAISTGVFGYPKDEAADVATRTVRRWLEEHPNALDLVVFNVFTAADEAAYRRALGHAGTSTTVARPFGHEAAEIRRWIDEADRVLIGAGAGLSADAGVDYTDEADFAAKFPALVARGLRAAYQMIGYSALPPDAFWGYWLRHVHDVRFGDGRRPVYQTLFDLVGRKDWFVLTSNVDALFARNGFDQARVCSIQGDFAFLQCLTPCSNELWPSEPVIERLLPAIDPDTQALGDPALVPTCPNCGGAVFFNVRGGAWFVEEPWRHKLDELGRWLRSAPNDQLLVLDIGSGFNTPSVVRWPMERTAKTIATARFVRINRHDPHLDVDLGARALTVAGGAREVLEAVAEATPVHISNQGRMLPWPRTPT
jgi:O-acetyl-ADP-ribose deacetylase (regulator of RNase III)/NAD-dependent SIR2 family protein deacetylase